jgi:pantothenate kinase
MEIPYKFSGLSVTWEVELAQRIRQQQHEHLQQNAQRDKAESISGTEKLLRHRPYMVAIVGIPGSVKTSSSKILTDLCGAASTLCMPFDGYHYPLEHLRNMMPDPDDKVYRRGAPDTFDAALLQHDLQRIRDGDEETIALPGFDHAKGDPERDQHIFHRGQHEIVITEGLYLLHDADGWSSIKDCFDFTVYIDADLNVCMDRLKVRNQCIPGYTVEEIMARVDAVDRMNAITVTRTKHRADVVVQSMANVPN